MRYLLIVLGLFVSFFGNAQSQGVTNAQTKLRPNQLRWSPTDATLDSVYIIRADTATGEPGWYLVTLGGGGVADTTLSGDVVGGLNSTFVRKINGVTVENKTPQAKEVLQYNGTQWTPDSIDLADLPTLAQSVLLGRGSASTGVPQAISLGTGLSMSGTTLSNSAPDQTVTISGATGTYPNFTVTPTSPAGSSMQVQYNNAGSFGALDSFTVSANPDRVGIGVPTPTARLDIQGSGSTSATNALRVRNSSASEILSTQDNGTINIGKNVSATTQNTAHIAAKGSDTNLGIAIVPKGSGAITANVPDGTSAGGNARGSYAVDLQLGRDITAQVASGTGTFTAGFSNTASANYSTVVGGYGNSCTGTFAITGGFSNVASAQEGIAMGASGRAYIRGQFSTGAYRFASSGDAQTSNLRVARAVTGTATSEIFIDNSSNTGRLTLPTFSTNGFWNARIQVIAVRKTVGNGTGSVGDTFTAEYSVGIKKISSTTSLVGTVNTLWSNSDANMAGASFTITADDTNDSLKIEYTPQSNAGSTTVTQVVATVYLTETSF